VNDKDSFKLLVIHFPAFKDWGITADQTVSNSWILPLDGPISLWFKDMILNMTFQIELDMYAGYLYPNIDSMEIRFG